MPEITYLKTECQHCKGHIEYPSELAGQSVECPHCKRAATLLSTPPAPLPPPRPVLRPARAPPATAPRCAGVGCCPARLGGLAWVLALRTVQIPVLQLV